MVPAGERGVIDSAASHVLLDRSGSLILRVVRGLCFRLLVTIPRASITTGVVLTFHKFQHF